MEKTTTYTAIADAFHCDFRHELGIGHLGNAILNAADMHSSSRNFGMRYLNTMNRTWVLSRLAIEVDSMPEEHETYSITTWVQSAMKYFTRRNWDITSEDGSKVFGHARSIWAMIDTVTRDPQDILSVQHGRILEYILPDRTCDMADVSRVRTPEMTAYSEFRVLYNDLDVNGHLNSIRYIDHVMDTFDVDFLRCHSLHRIEIAYVAEGRFGETIRIYNKEESGNYYYRFVRADETGETELARMLLLFNDR